MFKSIIMGLSFAFLSLSMVPVEAASLESGVFDETLTENLGAGDPIPYVELDFRHGAVAPVSFERRELTDSNGYHWVYYIFQMPQGERSATVAWEVGGGATGASLSSSGLQFDWSSRTGITSNPFGMEFDRYYLLTITSEAPSRLSGRRTDYFYFTLEEGGDVPPPDDNQAPVVNMSPVPGNDLAWQKNILDGQGFSIIVEDPDGIADIDWNSLKVSIAGVDKTQHFMTVVGTLIDEGRLSSSQGVDFQTFVFRPDPAKFTDSHNLFNLQWNGDWPVTIEVCDKGGLCGSTEYSIYIGPMLTVESIEDLRCTGEMPPDQAYPVQITGIEVGNIGFEALGPAYVGIQDATTGSVWTYYTSIFGNPILIKQIMPFFGDPFLMPTGFRLAGRAIDFPAKFIFGDPDDDFSYPLNSGNYKFLSGVLDNSTRAMALFERQFQICP